MNRLLLLICVLLCSCGGTSRDGWPGSEEEQSASADSCLGAHEQILADLSAIAEAHEQGCSSDSDCGLLELSIPCQEACAMPVLEAQRSAASKEVTAYAGRVCPDASTSCAVSSFCAPTQAVCTHGTCSPRF